MSTTNNETKAAEVPSDSTQSPCSTKSVEQAISEILPESYRLKLVVNPRHKGRPDFELAASIAGDWRDKKKLKDAAMELVSVLDQIDRMDHDDNPDMEIF